MICKKKTRNNYKKIYIYGFTKNIKKQSSFICLHYTRKKHFQEHNVVCLICDDLGWINYNYQMECLNGIIGKNNANNKKINSFEKS